MSQGSITVACTRLHELTTPELDTLAQLELSRAGEFKSARRREEYLCARSLLRNLLQDLTGEPASSHQLTTDDKGKPVCKGGLAVSIAHSGDLVVCGVADRGQIGVDIELPYSGRDIDGIASRYYAAAEVEWLATQPEDRFYMLWVLKEAWLKAMGTGIAGGLDRLSCFVAPPEIEARVADNSAPNLSLYALDDSFIGVATTSAFPGQPDLLWWDPPSSLFGEHAGSQLIATTG
jgi:4'-phosphopantetheinyl transferase